MKKDKDGDPAADWFMLIVAILIIWIPIILDMRNKDPKEIEKTPITTSSELGKK